MIHEIAQMIGMRKVVLLGSAVRSDELTFFAKTAIPYTGTSIVRFSQFMASFFKNAVFQAYSHTDPAFIVAMSNAIINWGGIKGDSGIVTRIHGEYDPFIRCPRKCHILKKAGHLIALTHAQECIDLLSIL